ncbi:Hypothetical_protein [Hexamita inflata]|uniref:Hypothetical_protein n=1 Tax=Hexamita inflata TaxID=28002 RepID=A0AA86Q182_9EUKA|nr:Hypothetical protein HINF_LOCUS35472 [Hexamita inflata]
MLLPKMFAQLPSSPVTWQRPDTFRLLTLAAWPKTEKLPWKLKSRLGSNTTSELSAAVPWVKTQLEELPIWVTAETGSTVVMGSGLSQKPQQLQKWAVLFVCGPVMVMRESSETSIVTLIPAPTRQPLSAAAYMFPDRVELDIAIAAFWATAEMAPQVELVVELANIVITARSCSKKIFQQKLAIPDTSPMFVFISTVRLTFVTFTEDEFSNNPAAFRIPEPLVRKFALKTESITQIFLETRLRSADEVDVDLTLITQFSTTKLPVIEKVENDGAVISACILRFFATSVCKKKEKATSEVAVYYICLSTIYTYFSQYRTDYILEQIQLH